MANVRMSRVNSEIQKCIAEIINNKINNPDIEGMIVAVNKVDTAPDLKEAKVYISILGSDDQKEKSFKAIQKSSGFIRFELSHMMRLKTVPNLTFKFDTSYEDSKRIMNLIDQIHTGEIND